MTNIEKDKYLARAFGFTDISYRGITLNEHKEYYVRLSDGRLINWCPSVLIDNALGDGGPGTVVGEMRKKHWCLRLFTFIDGHWEAVFHHRGSMNSSRKLIAFANTPTQAIVDAAIEALKATEK